ncbi:ComEC/Rec2 family competence protein [Pedobacter psychroterrae]|uniref:Metallo-beta-lactamase superfamily protein n=1 Tax=Pedobacter psychroterrae TaxID=2530453 RepID=A0A4R0NHL8_9SPHI|nr:hypothetical protein [Pedobacter psychroterrae]TCC99965.1 hypothetical protein EZ437_17145 [Pedobacter psychroterrae]
MSVTATIRMYNQKNLGDCFLLKFQAEDQQDTYILIDFGSYKSNELREHEIASHIKTTVGDKKLTIVLTHQHKDHISGFGTSNDILKGLPKELWLSFLDDENSKQGKVIREMTEKYWKKSAKVRQLLLKYFNTNAKVEQMLQAKESLDLFAEGQIGGKEMSNLLDLVDHNVKFLTPGDSFFLPGTNDSVKVYVLGPPTDNVQLAKLNPRKDEEVTGLKSVMEFAQLDLSGTLMMDALTAFDGELSPKENSFPFNKKYLSKGSPESAEIKALYQGEPDRKIDEDWLSEIGRMSLHMDKLTNNTSLVLAFELVDSRKVLLFVGDAQIGNWQSWFDVKFKDTEVDGKDLLSRTVIYKAGHHSSHNATLKQGLEMMNKKELTILVPVDEAVSNNHHFAMLRPEMVMGYHRQSLGRVLRSDTIVQSGNNFKLAYPFYSQEDFENLKVINDSEGSHLCLDLTIKG